ncbi:hypothetical protein D3C78_485230 [compost metagenome]
MQAEERNAGDAAGEHIEQQLAGQLGQHGKVQLAIVEQWAQLPVGIFDGQAGQALRLFPRCRGAERGIGCAAGACEHLVALSIFQQPFRGGAGAQFLFPVRAYRRCVEAGDDVAAAIRLAQQEIEQPALGLAEGVVIGVAGGAPKHAVDELLVADGGIAVQQALAVAIQPEHAVQGGIDALQSATQIRALPAAADGVGVVLFDQRLRGLCLEFQAQRQALGQLLGVQGRALALDALQRAEFILQMPEQHSDHQQDEYPDGALVGQPAFGGRMGR